MFPIHWVFTVGFSLWLFLLSAFAGDDNELGGDIRGTEDLSRIVSLVANTNAPHASGEAHLEAADDHGKITEVLDIQATGLESGTYEVSVTVISNSSTIVLGSVRVENGHGNGPPSTTHIQFGSGTLLPFPNDLNSLAIASVFLVDENGKRILTGDFSDLAQTKYGALNARVAIQGDSIASNATGQVEIHTTVKNGRNRGSFQLIAEGVPTDVPLLLHINGTATVSLESDQAGRVKLKKLPSEVDIGGITSIGLFDDSSNAVFKANF